MNRRSYLLAGTLFVILLLTFHNGTAVLVTKIFYLMGAVEYYGLGPVRSLNLEPFAIKPSARHLFWYNWLGNVALFVPFGFLVHGWLKRGIVRVTLIAFLLSSAIETAQYILPLHRDSDINDLMANTLGGLLGGLLSTIFLHFRTKKGLL